MRTIYTHVCTLIYEKEENMGWYGSQFENIWFKDAFFVNYVAIAEVYPRDQSQGEV